MLSPWALNPSVSFCLSLQYALAANAISIIRQLHQFMHAWTPRYPIFSVERERDHDAHIAGCDAMVVTLEFLGARAEKLREVSCLA